MNPRIKELISESIAAKKSVLADEGLLLRVEAVAGLCIDCFRQEGKVLFCGNGGSAADAQHLASELSGRYYFDREPLFAEALHVNSSFLTAVANDYSFEEAYARMLRAMGRRGDVLFALSTSGNSPNVVRAVEEAKRIGMAVVAMTGSSGGKIGGLCDYLINIPSSDTPRIQECHIMTGHLICELVETAIFGKHSQ